MTMYAFATYQDVCLQCYFRFAPQIADARKRAEDGQKIDHIFQIAVRAELS